ncbi:glycosyltransferase [Ferroplasma sp.]|uniref:glycosyltransferase family 4 protein n=1 Tax=Ferroplasma sp. TaxID=2591003 RepID=UPI00262F79A1|nr:glycosyltransferase [Ferroplasma sp.]
MNEGNDRVVIYSWNIPKGGLFKVIEKEHQYLSNKLNKVIVATSTPVPPQYAESFSVLRGVSLLSDSERRENTDISTFFPGLDIRMEDGIFRNALRLYLFMRSEKPSTVIAHQLLSSILLLPYSMLHKTPFVLVLHDNPFMFVHDHKLRDSTMKERVLSYVALIAGKYAVKHARSIISTTRQINEMLNKYMGNISNATVADYGMDTFPMRNIASRYRLMTVSKWSKFRRPEVYANLMRYLPKDVKMTFVGRWDSMEDLESFRSMVRSSALENRIETINDVSEEELSELYDETLVFLRLGFNETGTGQAVLEALGHGCPVVISRTLGASGIVKDGEHGFLVNESNLKEVASKIGVIFENNELAVSMSKACYLLAQRNSWDAYLEKIYDACIF